MKPFAWTNEAQACDQSPLDEESPRPGDKVGEDDRPSKHSDSGGDVEGGPEVSEPILSTPRTKKQKKKAKKAATSGWDIYASEQPPVLMDEAPATEDASPDPIDVARNLRWTNGPFKWNYVTASDVAVEPQNPFAGASPTNGPCLIAPEEESLQEDMLPAEEACVIAPEEESLQEDMLPAEEACVIAPEEESLREDSLPAEEMSSEEGTMGNGNVASRAMLEASQSEPIIEGFNSLKKHKLAQIYSIRNDLDDPYETTSKPDIALVHPAPAENAESFLWGPRCAEPDHSPRPWAPSSTTTSVLETRVPEAPTEDGHTIMLKILSGHKVFRAIVFIKACTRTAILNEARACYLKWAKDDCISGTQLSKECDLTLTSLNMDGCDMDLSTYKVEDLSFLVGIVEKTGVPRFTLQISGK